MLRLRARDLIRDLQALLGERYRNDQDGFSILKEVLQNADDVRATKVWLAWWDTEAVPEGCNSLLGRPGFLLLNDAGFESRHEEAFTSFSTSSKDSDSAQIGRFGIGRKSLFHWAETVCYLGIDATEVPHGGVLDPWAEQGLDGNYIDRRNASWTRWSDTEEAILRKRIKRCAPELGAQWFAIWLPARNAVHDARRRIVTTYPTLATLPTEGERLAAVARLLPQLVSVKAVDIVSQQGGEHVLHARIERRGESLGRASADSEPYEVVRHGEVVVEEGQKSSDIPYTIAEAYRWTPELTALRDEPTWPEEPAADFEGVDAMPTKAKAEPQGAVTVVWQTDRPGSLSLVPAIFLPVSGSRLLERFDLQGATVSCHMLLHGYFFPDSGRQEIEGLGAERTQSQDGAARVRREWNINVRRQVTLPLVLKAFGTALGTIEPASHAGLIAALADSTLAREEVAALTRDVQLACGPGYGFKVIPGDANWIELPFGAEPGMQADLERVGVAFGELGATVVWTGRRGVVASERGLAWNVTLVERLAAELADAFRKEPAHWLSWVLAWLSKARFEEAASPAPVVRQIYLACLQDTDWRKLLKDKEWTAITILLRPESSPVLWAKSGLIEAYRSLESGERRLAETIGAIVLSDELPRDGVAAGHLSANDSVTALEAIAVAYSKKRSTALSQLATLVLEATEWASVIAAPALHHLAFLPAWTSAHSRTLVSMSSLVAARDDLRVFLLRGMLQPESLASGLSDALDGTPEIVLVDGVVATNLNVPPFDFEAVATTLCGRTVVASVKPRLDFIIKLKRQLENAFVTSEALSDAMRVGLRRLIGGSSVVDLESPLLMVPERLSRTLVAALLGAESWRVLEEGAARFAVNDLPGAWRKSLLVKDADPSLLVSSVRRMASDDRGLASTLDSLDEQDRASLGTYLLEDRVLWASVPVHRSVDGRWVTLSERSYLESPYPVPADLVDVDLIASPSESAYAHALAEELETWSALALAKLGLARKDWHLVLEALGSTFDAESIRGSTEIRCIPWLPLLSGELAAPQRLISEEQLYSVTRALPIQPENVMFKAELASEVLRHRNWGNAQSLLVANPDATDLLLSQLASQGASVHLSFGLKTASISQGWLSNILSSDAVWAWWQVIEHLAPEVAQRHSELVTAACSPRRAAALLRYATSFQKPVPEEALAWYQAVLESLRAPNEHVPGSAIRVLSLPDAARNLRATSELCRGTRALPSQHRIHPQLEHLFAVPPVPGLNEDEEEIRIVALERWLEPWDDGQTPASLLGFLVAPLAVGDDPYAAGLFRRLLSADSAEAITRRLLETSEADEATIDAVLAKIKRVRLRIEQVTPGSRHQVVALDGTPFDVVFHPESRSLLVDILEGLQSQSASAKPSLGDEALRQLERMRPTRRIRMWQLDRTTDPENRNELIEATIEGVLRHLLGLRPKRQRFETLLRKQTEDTRHVLVAQHRLVRWLPPSLRQLRVHKHNKQLDDALTAVERAEHAEAELQTRQGSVSANETRRATQEVERARAHLRKLVEEHADSQANILQAIRARLKEFQYGEDQVLFELFQNADDAYAQRYDAGDPAHRPSFVVELDEVDGRRALVVRHRGRAIDRLYRPEDADKGWNRDLVNMLALGFSDKGSEDTGKFGLGFKSAYLLADEVHIQSGRSAFKVVGGVLPFTMHPFASPEETTFRFILRSNVGLRLILDRFQRLSPLLPLFTQQIARVGTKIDQRETSHTRRCDIIAENEDGTPPVRLYAADIHSPEASVGGRWLVAQDARTGRGVPRVVALHIRNGEFAPVDGPPTVWVTTPTRESRRLGFLVGGPFGIDVGRGRLGNDESNTDPAVGEVVNLVRRALELIEHSLLRDAEALGLTLGIGAGAARAATTLFDVLMSSRTQSPDSWERRLSRQVLAPPLLERVVLITDAANVRRRASEVDCVLSNELARRKVWEVMQAHFPLSAVAISEERDEQLRDLGYQGHRPVKTVLGMVTLAIPRGSRISSEAAAHLNALEALKPPSTNEDQAPPQGLDPETWSELRTHVGDLIVGHRANGTTRLGHIILDERFEAGAEEWLLASFAPACRTLATDDAAVARCVRLYRDRMAVPDEDLLKWASEATSESARAGVVTYFFLGSKRDLLVSALRAAPPSWLNAAHIRAVGAEHGFDQCDIDALLVRLGLERIAAAWIPNLAPIFVAQPRLTLSIIFRWWQAEESSQELAYQARVYPARWSVKDRLASALKSGDRHAWGTLFALAVCQRLGRVTPGQNRGFLESHGDWLATLADPESTPERWIALIDDWGTANWQSELYANWLGLFPAFRRLWRVMQDLTGLLATRPPVGLSAWKVFQFPSNEALSGTGTPLPNISRVFGSKGTVWIARELVRLGVWDFDPVQSYYVPWKLACSMTGRDENASPEEVARSLETTLGTKAPFGRCFDLPFDILRFDKSLRERLSVLPEDSRASDDWAWDDTDFASEE